MPSRRSLRVATYNVHACVGTDGRYDPERVAAVIAELDADIVAVQEFAYPVTSRSKPVSRSSSPRSTATSARSGRPARPSRTASAMPC